MYKYISKERITMIEQFKGISFKTILLKLFSIFSLFLLLTATATATAAKEPETHYTKVTIANVYYDTTANVYAADSKKDSTGGFWYLEIVAADQLNNNTLQALKAVYEGKQIELEYTGSYLTDAEIIDYKLTAE
jgi:hypothetical protein